MNALLPAARYAHVVVLNDDRTSYELAVQTIRLVFGKTEQEARQIASLTSSLGRCLQLYGGGLAIEEMLFSGGRLSRTLLGASDDAAASAS